MSRPHEQHDRFQIDAYSNYARINPCPPREVYVPALEFSQQEFELGGPRGYRSRAERYESWAIDHRGRLMVPSGLLPLVTDRMNELGIRYVVTPQVTQFPAEGIHVGDDAAYLESLANRFEPADDVMLEDGGEHRRMLEAVRDNEKGQIECTGFKNMIEKMSAICRYFPNARIIVPVATKSASRDIRWLLQKALGYTVNLRFCGRPGNLRSKCLVTTVTATGEVDPRDYDLMMMPDGLRVLGDKAAETLPNFSVWHGRTYGFVLQGSILGARDRMRLMAAAGQVISRIESHTLGVRVLWLPAPSCSRVGDLSGREWKRATCWQNDRRNEFVASVARSFATQNQSKLRKYGVSIPFTPMVDDTPRQPLVVVLVESVEHGEVIVQRLPGWQLLHARADERRPRVQKEAAGYIVTLSAASRYGLGADVLIRATGESGRLMFDGFPGVKFNDDDPDALIVDFDDRFDDVAAQKSGWRRREYEQAGWQELGPLKAPRRA